MARNSERETAIDPLDILFIHAPDAKYRERGGSDATAGRGFVGYDEQSLETRALGGIQAGTIQLALALAAKGHRVAVANPRSDIREGGGVTWLPLEAVANRPADVVAAINDPKTLDGAGALRAGALPMLWCRNHVRLGKTLARGRMGAFLRWRPATVFVGQAQAAACSRLIPLRGRHVIPHGLDERVRSVAPPDRPPAPNAVFLSVPTRGLHDTIRLWARAIRPGVPGGAFHVIGTAEQVTPEGWGAAELEAAGVVRHDRMPKQDVIALMRQARLLLYPGPRNETFCFVAAECLAMGVPVVTHGYAAMGERVRHGVDGFIERDDDALAARAVELLTDDALWSRMSRAAAEGHRPFTWELAADRWLDAIRQHRGALRAA